MTNRLPVLFAAAAAMLMPLAAHAYDQPPVSPPVSGTGSTGGNPASVPEPEQMALFGLAAAGFLAARRLHRRR